ncbi:glycine cleavage system aminomethyltransferase GcvT [Lentisphaerota bacterium ZTH]|nr:glycine cleavage system aminomethyltransferase GcvT [Lentisphaerota bacterium]WET06051.1 glycine cleavage system aminomethyltransferase GcvT [Lentisphaerota bacterium ZTH]
MVADQVFNTPLQACHESLGAKMVPFAGWNMPVQYQEGIIAEHTHCRNHAALFDICHMGEFKVNGVGALDALDRIFARPVFNQPIGVCRYNFLLNDDGKVMDDLIVYRLDEEEFFIVVNAGTRYSDAERIKSQLPACITFEDVSDQTAKLDLQGPESAEVLAAAGIDVAELPRYFRWGRIELNGTPILISRTGYTGELGFELYFDAAKAVDMWNYLLSFEQVKPVGLGARDTLRLEVGYALYGHELDAQHTPLDAGYGPMLKIDDNPDRNFTGKAALVASSPEWKLAAIALEGRRAARAGADIIVNERVIGVVTSGAFAPSVGNSVAMGYIKSDSKTGIGDTVELSAGRATLTGTVTELPFYKDGSVRKKL